MTKTTLTAALAALTLTLSIGSAFAATGYITKNTSVREGAGTKYHIVGSLKKGEEVDIVGCDDGWCEIDDEGYVKASFVKLTSTASAEDDDDDEDDVKAFDADEGEFDDDPLNLEDSVPESIFSGFDD